MQDINVFKHRKNEIMVARNPRGQFRNDKTLKLAQIECLLRASIFVINIFVREQSAIKRTA